MRKRLRLSTLPKVTTACKCTINTWIMKCKLLLAQSCLFVTPAFSVHGILQARLQEWVAIPFSWPRDRTLVSCIAGRFFTVFELWLSLISEPLSSTQNSSSPYPTGLWLVSLSSDVRWRQIPCLSLLISAASALESSSALSPNSMSIHYEVVGN